MGYNFINYKKTRLENERRRFSDSIREQGIGRVPIVIDSVEEEIMKILSNREKGRYFNGVELSKHMDGSIKELIEQIEDIIIKRGGKRLIEKKRIILGLENGEVIDSNDTITLGELYKKYRNRKDRILYILVSRKDTLYGYIMSIIEYIKNLINSRI